jgi:hypothetical protein
MNLAALLPYKNAREAQRMDRIIWPSVNVQIILPEDTPEAKSSQELPVRHCGDEIRGHLEVMAHGNFEFEIDVSFEGLLYIPIPVATDVTKVGSRPRPDLDWVRK